MSLPLIILLGITVATIGALPFGLVNLMVLDTAYNKGKRYAMNIAHGAAWIEVLFGLTAILIGTTINQFASENKILHYLFILFPGVVGLIFLFKKDKISHESIKTKYRGFLKGILYNLISFQVLLYWIIVIAFLSSLQLIIQKGIDILMFLSGIWIGKMTVLWAYTLISRKIFSRWQFLSSNMNRVIGSILLLTVFFQLFK